MIRTVSLKTAKLLRDAGFPHKSSFSYCLHAITGGQDYHHIVWDGQGITSCGTQYDKVYCPTSDEILEELPDHVNNPDSSNASFWFTIEKVECYYIEYGMDDYGEHKIYRDKCIENKSLPESLASMWLFLKKEKLI